MRTGNTKCFKNREREKIDGCSAQEAEIEPPAKTRLEPKKPSKGLGGREALGGPGRPWQALADLALPGPGKALAGLGFLSGLRVL